MATRGRPVSADVVPPPGTAESRSAGSRNRARGSLTWNQRAVLVVPQTPVQVLWRRVR